MSAMPKVPKEPFVSCDLCVEVKTLALKTCLKCEVSMCAQHLQTHLTTPVLLQTHPLTNPVESGSFSQMASKCSAHGKLVEYYCLTDHVLVCMSCAIEEGHRLHNMKTLQTAHMELSGQLQEELKALAQRENQAKELEKWHKDQTKTLKDCVSQLIKAESALKDRVFTSLQTSVSARLGALQTAQQAISSALKEEDHFNFLQKFASVHKAIMEARTVDLKQGLESKPDRTKLIEDIRKDGQMIEKQMDKLQRKFFAFADPEFFSVVQDKPNSASELTFDPRSLGPEMTLSEDLKKVFYRFSARNTLQASAGSYSTQTLRCRRTNEDASLHWFLNLSEHFDWTIGLCNTSAKNGNYSEVYGLKKQNNSLLSLKTIYFEQTYNCMSNSMYGRKAPSTETSTVSNEFHVTGPWKVEVIWDYASKLLTFYSRNKLTKGFLLCKLKVGGHRFVHCPFITLQKTTSTVQNRNTGWHQIAQPHANMSQGQGDFYTEILCVLKQ
ncbi:E3 ubiquitin-protein ligase TRIM62 [Garra rufa]|uniref:E3 ubiquitin-protein ligase TRIM62 n=1 Tax=Garra rufa TaxID=137080 RepID=UPI003CCE604F